MNLTTLRVAAAHRRCVAALLLARRLQGIECFGGKERYRQHQHTGIEGVVESGRPDPRFDFLGQVAERVGASGVCDDRGPPVAGEGAGERRPDVPGTDDSDVCAHDRSFFLIFEVGSC
jgi:hypothetical protein